MSSSPSNIANQSADATDPALTGEGRARTTEFKRSWDRFKRFRPGVVALGFIAALTVVAIIPGVFEPYSYSETNLRERGESPTLEHPLGRDDIGRDVLSRLIRGTRVAFIVAFAAMTISLAIGICSRIDFRLLRRLGGFRAFPCRRYGHGISTTRPTHHISARDWT